MKYSYLICNQPLKDYCRKSLDNKVKYPDLKYKNFVIKILQVTDIGRKTVSTTNADSVRSLVLLLLRIKNVLENMSLIKSII